MANIKSKKKNIRTIERNTKKNRKVKSIVKTAIKKSKIAIVEKTPEIKELVSKAQKQINVAVSKGILHKNNGARKQSKLSAFLKKNQ